MWSAFHDRAYASVHVTAVVPLPMLRDYPMNIAMNARVIHQGRCDKYGAYVFGFWGHGVRSTV